MGIILDTNVLIHAERNPGAVNFDIWADFGEAFITAVTCSELLVGVHKANTRTRRIKRAAFVEAIISAFSILEFDLDTARAHAEIVAAIPGNITLDAHDAMIAASAIRFGHHLLTGNIAGFRKIPGLQLVKFPV